MHADVFVYHQRKQYGIMGTKKAKRKLEDWALNVVEGTKDMILLPGSEEEDASHGRRRYHHELDSHARGFHPKNGN